jgi:hypothetical protein
MMGFATCGVYVGGGGLDHIRGLESLKTSGPHRGVDAAQRVGAGPAYRELPEEAGPTARTVIAVAVAVTMAAPVVITMIGSTGHASWSASLHHMGVLLAGRLPRRIDPFLVGGGLCVLAVLAFSFVVAVLTCPAESGHDRSSQTLLRGLGRDENPRASGPRIRGREVRRPADRRPPTMPSSSHPNNRPATLRSVFARAKR